MNAKQTQTFLMDDQMTYDEWKISRQSQAAGMLSLVGVYEVKKEAGKLGNLPGIWSEGQQGVNLVAGPEDHLQVNGQLITGSVDLDLSSVITFSPTRFGRVQREVYSTYFMQVWDTEAPNLREFDRIETYPYDPVWCLEAEFRISPEANRSFEVPRMTDPAMMDNRLAPADIHFQWQGKTFSLVCIATALEAFLAVSFTDGTSGRETPFSGRGLIIPRMPEGPFILDFNRAVLSPQEFSPAYPCPTTLSENRLPFAITAGEKKVLYKHRRS